MNTITTRMAEINTSLKEQHHDTANKKSHSPLTKIYPLCIAVLTAIIHFSVFQSAQAQDFWEEISFPDNLTIGSYAVNSNQELFVGTDKGIYFSNNEGLDWTCIGLENRILYSIIINEDGIIYAGSNKGSQNEALFKSVDNGLTWESILPDIGVTGNILDILTIGDTLFACLWGSLGSVIRSIDDGQNWDLVFQSENSSEHPTRIIYSNNEELYVSLSGYNEGMGGVITSDDLGESWEFIGLYNHQVKSISMNDNGDLFAACWGTLSRTNYPGLFVLRNENNIWDDLLSGFQLFDVLLTNDNHIYCSTASPNSIRRSLNDGISFEIINEGLPLGQPRDIKTDNDGFIYVSFLTKLAKSINPVVAVKEFIIPMHTDDCKIYPNPTSDYITIDFPEKDHQNHSFSLNIYNLNGELIEQHENFNSSSFKSLPIFHLPKGIYLIQVQLSTGQLLKCRLIIH